MKARLLLEERRVLSNGEDAFAELVVWAVNDPVEPSKHLYKYRLAFVVAGTCVLRYDNERGKGDHRHVGDVEQRYSFTTAEKLIEDFWSDVEAWRASREDSHH